MVSSVFAVYNALKIRVEMNESNTEIASGSYKKVPTSLWGLNQLPCRLELEWRMAKHNSFFSFIGRSRAFFSAL